MTSMCVDVTNGVEGVRFRRSSWTARRRWRRHRAPVSARTIHSVATPVTAATTKQLSAPGRYRGSSWMFARVERLSRRVGHPEMQFIGLRVRRPPFPARRRCQPRPSQCRRRRTRRGASLSRHQPSRQNRHLAKFLDGRHLVWASTRREHHRCPLAPPRSFGCTLTVSGQHDDRLDTVLPEGSTALATGLARARSATAIRPTASALVRATTGVRPIDGTFHLDARWRARLSFFEEAMIAEQDRVSVHGAFSAAPHQRRPPLPAARGSSRAAAYRRMAAAIGCSDRCSTDAAARLTTSSADVPFTVTTSTTFRRAAGERASLGRGRRSAPGRFVRDAPAPVDEHALAYRAGQSGDNGYQRWR